MKASLRRKVLCTAVVLLATARIFVGTALARQSKSAAPGAGLDGRPAPEFALKDGSGKTVKLADYRGKVLLLDFWATWCTGCKQEIPWFAQFQETYGAKGFAAVGVSMDDGGWTILKPFLASHPIPYPIVLADEDIAKRYAIDSMPDTFLIDRHGKVAASYRGQVVDKDAVEAKIRALLAER
jgi:peroxiredoxin